LPKTKGIYSLTEYIKLIDYLPSHAVVNSIIIRQFFWLKFIAHSSLPRY